MPRKKRIKDSNDRKLTLAGKKLSPWLVKLTDNRALPLAPRSLIRTSMPPLAFHIWQQIGHLRGKSSRLAGWVTDYTGGRILPSDIQLPAFTPILSKPPTLSPVWQRLHDLSWFRQRRKRRNEPNHGISIVNERQLADWFYPDTLLQTVRPTKEERLVNAANEPYPIVIKNLLTPPVAREALPYTTDDSFHPPHATSVTLPVKPVADELGSEDIGGTAPPHISSIKIPSLYQAEQIQRTDRQQVKAQASWQPQHTYQNRWLDGFQAPLTQRLVLYRAPVRERLRITHESIEGAYAFPIRHWPYLTTTKAEAEPGRPVTQPPPPPPYIANIPEIVTSDEETIPTLGKYSRPVTSGKGSNLLYSLPDQSESTVLRPVLERSSLSDVPRATRSLNELVFNSLPPDTVISSKDFGVLSTEVAPQRAPETLGERAKTIKITKDLGSMTPSQVTSSGATPDNVSLSQRFQTSEIETPLIHQKLLSISSLGHQPLSVTESIRQTPALPAQKYSKSVDNAPSLHRTDNYSFLWNQDLEPTSLGHKDTHRPAPDLLLASVIGPKLGSKVAHGEGPLPVTFERTAYYGSQPTPELALAPVEHPAEAVSPTSPKAEVKAEETTKEAAAPDIDTIARDVYHILKRRLARERERALGLS